GHSMGGVLARVYASDSYTHGWYLRKENFMRGDIHRLITVCSTHRGSDVMRFMAAVRQGKEENIISLGDQEVPTSWAGLFADLLSFYANKEQAIETEAPNNQIPGSDAVRKIDRGPIAVHAIACYAVDNDLDQFYKARLRKLWWGQTPALLRRAFEIMGQKEQGEDLAVIKNGTAGSVLWRVILQPILLMGGDRTFPIQQKWEGIYASGTMHAMSRLRSAVFRDQRNDCTVVWECAGG